MDFSWVKVFEAEHALEANIIKGLLESSGLTVQLKGESLQGALGEIPFTDTQVSVWVYDIKLPHAQEILLEYQESKTNGPKWRCQHCQQLNPANFDVCWSCMKEQDE